MAKRTFAGIEVSCFAHEPKPSEVAGIVADMTADESAEFFSALAEQMNNQGLSLYALKNIAEALCDLEDRLCDGGGSRLIRTLSANLKVHA